MGIADIAQELHLDPWMIEALEADDFEALGAPVFAKGHLRQYGALLGLATDDLMIAYYRVRGRNDTPAPPITATMSRPEKSHRGMWAGIVLAVVVLGALAAVLWFFAERDAAPAPASDPALSAAPDPAPGLAALPLASDMQSPAAVTDGQTDTARPAAAGPAASEPAVNLPATTDTAGAPVASAAARDQPAAAARATAPAMQAAPGEASVTLRLEFSGESWVEVYDRNGNRLIYGMYGPAGSRTVTGATPIEIYLGRSRDVTLAVNGRDYPVPAASIRGNTARFVIEDGVR